MPTPIAPFVRDRFSSTVSHYVTGRLDYPRRLIGNVARWLGVSQGDRVLDLGCGPGFLAISFAELGCEVSGLDPDVAMLAAARKLAAEKGVACEFREGSSYDLSPAFGRFKLVTMGRSFHWMDRQATLAALDGMIEADGAVALFGDHHPRCRQNGWLAALDEIRLKFELAEEFRKLQRAGEVDRHEIPLLASAFSCLESLSVTELRPLGIDGAVERALSFSNCAPHKLGDRRPAFEAELRAALAPFAPDGQLTELVEFIGLIGRRPERGA